MSEALLSLVPVAVALLTFVGGGIGYVWQKRADRHGDLIKTRQALYQEYLFAQQRTLTSCIRIDPDSRRKAIDSFRSAEAALYVAAPKLVAERLGAMHLAFVDYTRCVRCIYEPNHAKKFGKDFPPSRLIDLEEAFLLEYRAIVARMRNDTLRSADGSEIPIELSLASKEVSNP